MIVKFARLSLVIALVAVLFTFAPVAAHASYAPATFPSEQIASDNSSSADWDEQTRGIPVGVGAPEVGL